MWHRHGELVEGPLDVWYVFVLFLWVLVLVLVLLCSVSLDESR